MKEYVNTFPWTLSVVDEIKLMWVRVKLDNSNLHTEAVSDVKNLLVDEFNARLFDGMMFYAVDYHDCVFHEELTRDGFQTEITLIWRPNTKEVYFYGGPLHDTLMAVPNKIGETYHAVLTQIPTYQETLGPDSWKTQKVRYELDGWDPTRRCWIYRSKEL